MGPILLIHLVPGVLLHFLGQIRDIRPNGYALNWPPIPQVFKTLHSPRVGDMWGWRWPARPYPYFSLPCMNRSSWFLFSNSSYIYLNHAAEQGRPLVSAPLQACAHSLTN